MRRVDAADCDDLVKTRTKTINWVHVVLTNLIPGRAPPAPSPPPGEERRLAVAGKRVARLSR